MLEMLEMFVQLNALAQFKSKINGSFAQIIHHDESIRYPVIKAEILHFLDFKNICTARTCVCISFFEWSAPMCIGAECLMHNAIL